MATVVCPHCFHEINNSRLAYQCVGVGSPGRARCEREPDAARFELTGYRGDAYPTFVPEGRRPFGARLVDCPDCGGPTGQRACPVCHTPVTSTFADSRSPLVGIVGGTGTGKTVYTTVLEHELRGGVARRFRADVRLAGDQQDAHASSEYLNAHEQRLFGDGRLADKTVATTAGRRPPLMLEWRAPRSRLGREVLETSTLSLYDAAGEDFQTQATANSQRYLGVGDGLVVLLDPWQLPGLRGRVAVPHDFHSEPPITVLNRVTEMLRTSHGTNPRKRVDVPLAVVFAKFDAVFPLLDPTDPLFRLPPPTAGYDEQAGETMHEQVRTLLKEFDATDIDIHLESNYKTFRYFAASALGAVPDYAQATVDPGGVRPFRVEEPLLWLLQRFGIVERSRA